MVEGHKEHAIGRGFLFLFEDYFLLKVDSFNNMLVDVAGKDFLNEQFIQVNLHSFRLRK